MVYQIKELTNGIRIVHQEVNSTRLVHCGFILDIGSRDEKKSKKGWPIFGSIWLLKAQKKEGFPYH